MTKYVLKRLLLMLFTLFVIVTICFMLIRILPRELPTDKNLKEVITARAAVPTVIDEYYHDTWSHRKNRFEDVLGRFSDATVTVVEEGPLRATVKAVSPGTHRKI